MIGKFKFIPNIFGWVIITAGFIIMAALLYALPLWLIWNWTVPRLFGGPTLTLLDAFLLNILTGILFKSRTENK
ncbi:MAG: hypothetical protein V1859_09235 [archaeon]